MKIATTIAVAGFALLAHAQSLNDTCVDPNGVRTTRSKQHHSSSADLTERHTVPAGP
jgi:hypothetical protein